MSQEAVPEQTVPQQSAAHSASEQKGAPKGLLQQMEELMAALSADLTQLDADLQSTTADRTPHANGAGEAPQTDESSETPRAGRNEEPQEHPEHEGRQEQQSSPQP
ncbi:hypothetical protein ABZX93_15535 [Streptomyces sp. NPDC006632]|uniref:hypothetical protein n=1 Tax=unclassified Streptomyces TaxID=2593676 RepID=UPI002E21B8E7